METYIGSVEANASNGVSSSKQIRIRHNGMLVIYAKSDMLIRQYVTGSASISHNDTILWQNTKNSTGWYTINLFEGWKCFSINENDIITFKATNVQANESGAGATTSTISYYIAVY